MPSRRRKTETQKATASATREEAPRSVVTQVVEVVEEVPLSEPQEEPVKEDVAPPVAEPPPEEETVRKERVEELYQNSPEPPMMPEISVHNKKSPSLLVWAIVTILIALLTGGILLSIAKKTSPLQVFVRPTPTPTEMPTPTPTPTPAEVDKTSFEIRVLNGGGTPGAAGKMKTFLEDKGYTVSGTGNTDEYTYTSTEIHGKPEMKDAVERLKADLEGTYTVGTVAEDLSASASSDIQVIVGKE